MFYALSTPRILLATSLALTTVACTDDDGDSTGSTAADTSAADTTADPPTTGATDDPSSASGDTSGSGSEGTTAGTTTTDGTTTDDTTTGVVPTEKFSFFVTSLIALQELSGSQEGFGGDLRFGEMGPGAGLRGADKICATIAEKSMPGAGNKQWRAFLSAVADENGNQVDAIDRIGEGPWYDRLGRTFALTKADVLFDRPMGIDPAIKDDFPNEDGVPNHQPDPNQPEVDNHDMLTGTNEMGQLYSQTATCADWTGSTGTEGKPRVGHSWPRYGMGGMKPPGINPANWMSSLDESGCAPGVSLIEMGPPDPNSDTVGSGGGYGGFYCFSLTP
jgi:hypothetical protein